MLGTHHLTITFFVVGQDAARSENREAIASIAAAGHEISSHSYDHDPWLHLYTKRQIEGELTMAEETIGEVTEITTSGFRGPGFSMTDETLRVLMERGYDYDYDATLFPNVLNPVGRLYYFMSSSLSREERKQRKALFGTMRDALRPNVPFRWEIGEGHLLEVPLTTMPFLRIPFHFSYLLWLAGFGPRFAERYFRTALWLCARTGNSPSLLIHPLDFLGSDDEPELGFFPGMKLESGRKLELMGRILDVLRERFDPITLGEYTSTLAPSRTAVPNFPR